MKAVIRKCAALAAFAIFGLPVAAQSAEPWPTRPVRIIVPYPAGGVGDLGTRAFAARLADTIGQSVVVENMPGGTQVIGVQAAAKSAPDGHTLVLVSPTSMVLNPALRQSLPYSPDRLTLVSRLFSSPLFVITSNSLPANSIQELIAHAKAHPDEVNYGSTGEGSATHLATELFAQTTGIRMKHVPYKGSAGTNVDLMGGILHVHFDPGAGTLALVKQGRLKALAVTGQKRSRSLPDVPTVMEAGVSGYDVQSWWGLAAPEGVPVDLAERISAAVAKALAAPSLADESLKLAIDYGASTPAEFRAFVGSETKRWGEMIGTLGLKKE